MGQEALIALERLRRLFDCGKDELSGGNCDAARNILPDITAKMYVPMVQGTLRYAYKVAHQGGTEKEKAEGAIFAAAVLPKVHSICKSLVFALSALNL